MLSTTGRVKPKDPRAENRVESRISQSIESRASADRERKKQESQHLLREGENAESSFHKKRWLRTIYTFQRSSLSLYCTVESKIIAVEHSKLRERYNYDVFQTDLIQYPIKEGRLHKSKFW